MTAVTRRTAWLAVEAALVSSYVRVVLDALPFRRVRPWLGTPQDASTPVPRTADLELLRDVQRAVGVCGRYLPWTNCYSLALTAKIMLARRNVPATLFMGVRHDDRRQLAAHAWLMNGDTVVAGDGDLAAFAVHGRYC